MTELTELHKTALIQLIDRMKDMAGNDSFTEAADMLISCLENGELIEKKAYDRCIEMAKFSKRAGTIQTISNMEVLAKWLEQPEKIAEIIDSEQSKAGEDEEKQGGVYAGTVFALQSRLTQETDMPSAPPLSVWSKG